jgi:HK97 family phage major capsid protein
VQYGSMIELLRNNMAVMALGARSLSGLVGNVAIPKHTGGATAYWLDETTDVTGSQQTFGQLGLVPHRLAAKTAYTKQLLAQASIDIEGFVREDIAKVQALAKDLAAINGSGVAGEPLGILNTTGVNSVTFSAAATWAKVVSFETEINSDNALAGSLGYLTTPAVKGTWKTAVKVSGQAIFLWESGDMVNGYKGVTSKQVPSDKVIFGNWSDLIVADWDGVDVVVDPYSLAGTNQVQIIVTIMTDCAVRNPVSFTISSDSGAQ